MLSGYRPAVAAPEPGGRNPGSVSQEAARRQDRAAALARHGNLDAALGAAALPATDTLSLSEATVLGLHRQGVRTYLVVLGHGSTDLAEVLRVYATAGAVTVLAVRHETEASHAATALRLTTGEKAAVVTSIGPGALQALAGSLSAASNCCGVWYLCGDETTEDEGPNLQQVPGTAQHPYLRLMSALGPAYVLHTPQAVGTALRRGLNVVDHPHQAGPFYLLLPINTQPALLTDFNLRELPAGAPPPLGPAADLGGYAAAGAVLRAARRVVVRAGEPSARGPSCWTSSAWPARWP